MVDYRPPPRPGATAYASLPPYSSPASRGGTFTPTRISSFSPSSSPKPAGLPPLTYKDEEYLPTPFPRPSSRQLPPSSALHRFSPPAPPPASTRLENPFPQILPTSSTSNSSNYTPAPPPTRHSSPPPPPAARPSTTSPRRVSTAEGGAAVVEEKEGELGRGRAVVQEGEDGELGNSGRHSTGGRSGIEGREGSADGGEEHGPAASKRRKLDGDAASEVHEGERASPASSRLSPTEDVDASSSHPPPLRPAVVPALRPPQHSYAIDTEESDTPYVFNQRDLPEDAPRIDPQSSAFDIPLRRAGQKKSKKRRIIIFIWWDSKTRRWRIIIRVLPFVRRWMEWVIFQETDLRPDEYDLIIPIVVASATKSFDKLPIHRSLPDEHSIHRLFDNDGELLRNAHSLSGIGPRAISFNISAWIQQLFVHLPPQIPMIFTRIDKPQPIKTTPEKLGEAVRQVLKAMGLQVEEGQELPTWDMERVTKLRRQMSEEKFGEDKVELELFVAIEAARQFLIRVEQSDLGKSINLRGLGRRFPKKIVSLSDFDLDRDEQATETARVDQDYLVKGGPRQQVEPRVSTRPRPPPSTAILPLTHATSKVLSNLPRISKKPSIADSASSSTSLAVGSSASTPRTSTSIPRTSALTSSAGPTASAGSSTFPTRVKPRPKAKRPAPDDAEEIWWTDWSFFDEEDCASLVGGDLRKASSRASQFNDGQNLRTENARVLSARIRERVLELVRATVNVKMGTSDTAASVSQVARQSPYDRDLIKFMNEALGVRFAVRVGNPEFKGFWAQAMRAAGGWSTSELEGLWKEDTNTLRWLYLALGSDLIFCKVIE